MCYGLMRLRLNVCNYFNLSLYKMSVDSSYRGLDGYFCNTKLIQTYIRHMVRCAVGISANWLKKLLRNEKVVFPQDNMAGMSV